jgi:hypothetical protein
MKLPETRMEFHLVFCRRDGWERLNQFDRIRISNLEIGQPHLNVLGDTDLHKVIAQNDVDEPTAGFQQIHSLWRWTRLNAESLKKMPDSFRRHMGPVNRL